ncbi:MAG: hypothetical protein AAGE59_39390 [Cyanobacteria bacterium P01_F01_bin.86]
MKRKTKIVLDFVVGFAVPVLILQHLSEPWGAMSAHIVVALVPMAWILISSCFIPQCFNFMASDVGTFALIQSLLALWLVNGMQFALQDTMGLLS